jgi:hypothetical protein
VDKEGKRSVDCFQTNSESFALGLELEMKGVMGNKRRNEDGGNIQSYGSGTEGMAFLWVFMNSLTGIRSLNIYNSLVVCGPPLWSSGQSFWLQIRRPGFDSRRYQKKK